MTPTRKKKKPKPKTTRARTRRVRPKAKRHARAGARRSVRKVAPRKRRKTTTSARPRRAVASLRRGAALRPSRRAAPERAVSRAGRPALRVVRPPRPVRAPKSTASARVSFPQRGGATPRQLVLFELIRARAALLSAIHGLTPASANEPMGDGRWSVRETVLHLVTRDQARLRESESTRRGQPPSWKGVVEPAMGQLNAELMAPLRHLDWEDAVRTLHRVREQLIEEIESVPEEPAEVWSPEHPFGWMLHALPPHDRHHADSIKRWRLERTL